MTRSCVAEVRPHIGSSTYSPGDRSGGALAASTATSETGATPAYPGLPGQGNPRPVGEVQVRRRVQDHQVGRGTDPEVADVTTAQRSGAAPGGRGQGLRRRHAHLAYGERDA